MVTARESTVVWLGFLKLCFLLLGSPNLRTRPPPRRESSLVCMLNFFSLSCPFSGAHSSSPHHLAVSMQSPLFQHFARAVPGLPASWMLGAGREAWGSQPYWGLTGQFIIKNALHSKAK